MAIDNIFELSGLKTFKSELVLKPGGLLDCSNVVMNRAGTIDSRRGFKEFLVPSEDFPNFTRLIEYQGFFYGRGDSMTTMVQTGAATTTEISMAQPADATIRQRDFQINENLYLNTINGVQKFESQGDTTPAQAGVPKGLDGEGSLTNPSGWFEFDRQVAYRVVWGIRDVNDTLYLGAPSGRIEVVQNAGSGETRDVSLTIQIPPSITTTHFFQVYRSFQSASASTPGNDEMDLVYEANPTSSEITAKELTFTDSTPDSLRGARIYTAPSQDGILNANNEPPFCKDMTLYKNMSVFANTRLKQTIEITLLGVGSPNGIQDGDKITIAGVTYEAINDSGTPDNNEFIVEEALTPAENVDITARNLVEAINKSSSNTTVVAYYESGFIDLPGRIRIEERNYSNDDSSLNSAFTVQANANGDTAWSPNISSAQSSSADADVSRIYFSKVQQYESVPFLRFIDVGSKNFPIQRIFGLTDGIIVLKDDGVFAVYGETFESLVVQQIDNSAIIVAPATGAVLDNRVYYLSRQGVVFANMNGVALVSRDIEEDMLQYLSSGNFPNTARDSFAVAYESDRKYILCLPNQTLFAKSDVQFVYDVFTKQWTKWGIADLSSGIVHSTEDLLYFYRTDSTFDDGILVERKNFNNTDYADKEYAVTISDFDGINVDLVSNADAVVGYYLVQGSNSSRIVSIGSGEEIQVADEITWTLGAATLYEPISVNASFLPFFAKLPGASKNFIDVKMFFRNPSIARYLLDFHTDVETTDTQEEVIPTLNSTVLNNVRTFVPRAKVQASFLYLKITHAEARIKFALSGVSLNYEEMSERQETST